MTCIAPPLWVLYSLILCVCACRYFIHFSHSLTHTHTFIHTHTHTLTHTHTHTHTLTHTHTYTHTHTLIHTHTLTHTLIHTLTHTHSYILTRSHTHSYIHSHMLTHIRAERTLSEGPHDRCLDLPGCNHVERDNCVSVALRYECVCVSHVWVCVSVWVCVCVWVMCCTCVWMCVCVLSEKNEWSIYTHTLENETV